jgi:3-hydroxyisobutyrate dehydrogenase
MAMAADERVAVLGAGSTMGFPMARNIANAGIDTAAWNRSPEKAEPLGEHSVDVGGSPSAAVAGATIVVTMLADGDAVTEVIEPVLGDLGDGAIWLQMSTIGEAATERCAELANGRGVTLIDAPVLGTKQPAEDGKLVVLAAGPEDVRDRVQPIFDAVGQKTMWLGDVGDGQRLKMVVNSWVLTVTEGCAETIALAQGLGLDPSLLFDAIDGGGLDLPYLRMKGKAILEHNFEAAFKLSLAAKDAGLINDSASRHDLDLPLFAMIRDRMLQSAKEHGDEDMIATWFASAPAGVEA